METNFIPASLICASRSVDIARTSLLVIGFPISKKRLVNSNLRLQFFERTHQEVRIVGTAERRDLKPMNFMAKMFSLLHAESVI